MTTKSNFIAASPSEDDKIVVTFGKLGSINSLASSGFDLNDGDQSSWTEQQIAWLEIAPRWPAKDLTLRFDAMPFLVESHLTHQQVFIYANGLFCGLINLFERQSSEVHIPRNAISGRTTRITFAIPTAKSPQRLGISEDVRTLGVAFTALSLGN